MHQTTATAWSGVHLAGVSRVEDRVLRCPHFLQQIIAHAKMHSFIQRIWLFGSRAKGTHRSLSDYDLAFACVADCSFAKWAKFVQQEESQLKTLLSVDWVFFNQADELLRNKIVTEGIVLYEQT